MVERSWSVAVFAVNEERTIADCLRSIDANCAEAPPDGAVINLLLNGTTDGTLDIVQSVPLRHAGLRVFHSATADKANALNFYIYGLRPADASCFFVDGYISISEGAFQAMTRALRATHGHANAASAIPILGRSAKAAATQLLAGGAIWGGLFTLKPEFLDRFVNQGLRLPRKMYRNDALLGSMAAHDLDAIGSKWDSSRLIGVPGAAYSFAPFSPLRWRDIKRQFRREIRQARGSLENAAVKSIIYVRGYAGLPEDSDVMIRDYVARNKAVQSKMRQLIFSWLALRQLRSALEVAGSTPAPFVLVLERARPHPP